MTTDRELLEKAAKAAGIAIYFDDDDDCYRVKASERRQYWNPLAFDGDALRLAVKLRIDVVHFASGARADVAGYEDCYQAYGADPYAATRRAIVRAAAAIGKETP